MINKIQSYLLIRYPLLWQSKFVPMMIIALLLWLLAYIWGYLSNNLEVIKDSNLTYYYSRYFLAIHAILALIIYVLWALYFFRTNPLFQYYPLRKGYLLLLYIQIMIPLFLILSLYYPFTKGMYDRTKSILSEQALISDSKTINLAYPFLVVDIGQYEITHRTYPEPFPLEDFHRSENDTDWVKQNVYYRPKFTHGKFDNTNNIYYPTSEAPVTEIDGHQYIFYKSHGFTATHDSCTTVNYSIIDTFIKPSPSLGLYYYAVQNYSDVYIFSGANTEGNYVFPTRSSEFQMNHQEYFKEIAPVIYPWIQTENSDSIFQCIEAFKRVCDKYQIKYRIPTKTLVDSLIHTHFKLSGNFTDNGVAYRSDDNYPLAAVNFTSIENIYDNYNLALKHQFDSELFFGLLMLSIGLSALLIIAFAVDIISILISIPVTGIVFIFCGLLAMSGADNGLLVVYFLLSASFIIAGYLAVVKTGLTKRVANILLCLGFYAIPFATFLILEMGHEFSEETIYRCGNEQFIHHFEYTPWHAIVLFLILFILYLPLLIKLKAKEE